MSLETWKEEFLPISAEEANNSGNATVGELLEHALKKWQGATFENLTKHGLVAIVCDPDFPTVATVDKSTHIADIDALDENSKFYFFSDTCALCVRFYPEDMPNRELPNRCNGCPLYYDGRRCFVEGRGYAHFNRTASPDLMLHELSTALEKWRKENA